MKLLKLYEKIGKQPIKEVRNKDVIVHVNGERYFVNKIKYDSGKFDCLEAVKICCNTCDYYKKDVPHTCDVCTSLDNEDDYSIWKCE